MRIGSADACRRLVHLAFRDAHTALDLTYAAGGFWKAPLPPGLTLTTNNVDPEASTDLHVDFRATGVPAGSYDLVVYDPPHVADGGSSGIMSRRYGTIRTVAALRDLITAGAAEAWRVSSVGILVKVTEHHHGGRFLDQSAWVAAAIGVPLYTKLSTVKARSLTAGRWRAERVPRSNGAVYLVFRHDGPSHVDFDALYRRQEMSHVTRRGPACPMCDMPMWSRKRRDAVTCSPRCRKRAERARRAR